MTANKNANTILPLLDLKNAVAIASTLYGMSNSEMCAEHHGGSSIGTVGIIANAEEKSND